MPPPAALPRYFICNFSTWRINSLFVFSIRLLNQSHRLHGGACSFCGGTGCDSVFKESFDEPGNAGSPGVAIAASSLCVDVPVLDFDFLGIKFPPPQSASVTASAPGVQFNVIHAASFPITPYQLVNPRALSTVGRGLTRMICFTQERRKQV